MTYEVRCPKCGKRLFDVTEKTVGPVNCKCKCKEKVLVVFHTLTNIQYTK